MTDEHTFEEGWYRDPFGRHEARWISDGQPTTLVCDGDTESYDLPPEGAPTQPLERIEVPADEATDDLYARSDADHQSLHERLVYGGEEQAPMQIIDPYIDQANRSREQS